MWGMGYRATCGVWGIGPHVGYWRGWGLVNLLSGVIIFRTMLHEKVGTPMQL